MCTGIDLINDKDERMFNIVYQLIRAKMAVEEGVKFIVYLDSLDKLTGGIGHLITPEDNMVLGQRLSHQQVNTWFKEDVSEAIRASIEQAKEVGEFEVDFVTALTSVNFQLGIHWPKKWPNTYKALKAGKLEKVIKSITKSLWNKQTPSRVLNFKMALLQEIAENNRKVVV